MMIDDLMLAHEAQIEACYTEHKKRFPNLEGGEITLRAEHANDGSFQDLRQLRGFVGSGPIYDCVAEIVSQWKTEAPYTRGPVDLSWKFEHTDDLGQGLKVAEIREVLNSHQSDFDRCFLKISETQPEIEGGNIKFDIGIRPNGKIKDMRLVEGFQGSQELFACIEKEAAAWQFPVASSDSQARWEWSFRILPKLENEQ